MKVSGIIFDFDGTISDTIHVSDLAMKAVYRQATGKDLDDSTVSGYSGPTEEEFVSRLLPHFPDTAEHYLAEFARQHSHVTQPFDGVVQLIDSVRELGIPVSMVTAKGPRVTQLSFEKIPVRHLFDSVYTATPEGGIAKGPSIADQIEIWSLEPGNAAYIGDTQTDMTQAMSAGVVPLGAAWGGAASAVQLYAAGAEAVFTSPDQVLDWLSSH